jgi:hypothetical protein
LVVGESQVIKCIKHLWLLLLRLKGHICHTVDMW